MTFSPITVLIVDDDTFVCSSLETIISADKELSVVGTTTSGAQAIHLSNELDPDIILMDIQMPQMTGLEAAEKILALRPEQKIVFLTTFSDDEYIVQALRLGTQGYLIKQEVSAIAQALKLVMAGQTVLGSEVTQKVPKLVSEARESEVSAGTEALLEFGLTHREAEVIELIAQGYSNDEIARELHISGGTVRNRISDILSQLGLKSRTQIAVWYYTRP